MPYFNPHSYVSVVEAVHYLPITLFSTSRSIRGLDEGVAMPTSVFSTSRSIRGLDAGVAMPISVSN